MLKFISYLLVLTLVTVSVNAQPSGLALFDISNVVTCVADVSDAVPPDFTGDTCKAGDVTDIDPQGTLVWVKTIVRLDEVKGPKGEPLSLYISGKFSSRVYLNGEYVGSNGTPGFDAASEMPGRMDVELFPPQNLFRRGDNEVVFLASSYHGFFDLKQPLHLIGIAPTGLYGSDGLRQFGSAFLTLGLFLVGSIYFGTMAYLSRSRCRFATLSAICFFAAGQLLSETWRGIAPYVYPVHDIRLLAIACFSLAFGLGVSFHILRSFTAKHIWPKMAMLAIVSSLAAVVTDGFDYKALVGMTLPLLITMIATGFWSYKRRPRAFVYFLSLLIFVAAIVAYQGLFLDTVFFLLVAFFLLLLFIEQAFTLAEEMHQRRREEVRANKLEQALAEIGERAEASFINIKSAGKMDRIPTSDIVRCQGASGYSEIILKTGRSLIHSATLNEMEEILPATFLRVHRSHLINTMFVKSLDRDPSGTGILQLSEGPDVPVSRRVMPKVRQELS